MKSIEDFDLQNIEFVHRYLSGKLSVKEEKEFHKRLKYDAELREDLELAKKYLDDELENNYSPDSLSALQEYKFENIRAERKALVGQNIVSYGLWAALSTIFMVLTCITILYLLLDK
ncbi:MAG: hypothetical protein ACPGJS_14960 [Flammeovirgaceae bacterium]